MVGWETVAVIERLGDVGVVAVEVGDQSVVLVVEAEGFNRGLHRTAGETNRDFRVCDWVDEIGIGPVFQVPKATSVSI